MKSSNIDVDIIDETLLYICIDGKREHISVDNARIKYAKNKDVLDLIDLTLERYVENSKPLESSAEPDEPDTYSKPSEPGINDIPLEPVEVKIDASSVPDMDIDSMPSNDEPLPEPKDEPVVSTKPEASTLRDLNDSPLELVDESKFATIYSKYNREIGKTFKKDAPSFLDLERIAEKEKPLELVK